MIRNKQRIITFALIISLSAIWGGAPQSSLAAAGANPQLLTGILQKMEKAHRDLKSLKASIMQQKTNVQIRTTDTDYGTLIYKPAVSGTKGRLRIDYTKPDTRTVSVVGDNFIFYQPRINQVLKTTLAKASKGRTGGYAQIVGLDSSAKSLANNYDIEYVRDETIDGQLTTQLRLTPKSGGGVKSIELWVHHQSGLPIQQKFYERNGDYTFVKLTNLQPNVKLSDDAFIVKYPGNTVVVDKI